MVVTDSCVPLEMHYIVLFRCVPSHQRAVDEKFRCVEEKEGEMRRLQLLLREKERDLERQRCVLSNNEETITVLMSTHTRARTRTHRHWLLRSFYLVCVLKSLEVLVRGKGLELEQVCEAWRSVQRHHEDREERHSRSLRERDTLISQLQNTLHTRTSEAEVTCPNYTLATVFIYCTPAQIDFC